MDDDLMGRLVANAGVDCKAAGSAEKQCHAIPAHARAEQEVMSMTYPIRTIEDIDSDEAAALRSIGIRTTEKAPGGRKKPEGT